jgi:hypothetical protein
VIVVLGRPGLSETGRADVGPGESDGLGLAGRAARIALAARAAGAAVELVGSVGDDPDGDQVVVRLGRAGIGHSAVLRDPSARTPMGALRTGELGAPAPRLEPADISLGLSYVTECRVLVIAEPLPADALAVAADAAAYHGAAIVAIVEEGSHAGDYLPVDATLLEAPREEPMDDALATAPVDEDRADADAAARSDAFNRLVAQYAVALDRGEDPGKAFRVASGAAGWEAVSP